MRRGVFALTWFLLLSTSLVNLYSLYSELNSKSLELQSKLMDADELFYMARNFEWDFANTFSADYWQSVGNLTFGFLGSSECIQTPLSFRDFLTKTKNLTTGLGFNPSCVVLEISYKNFKTFGVLKSSVCVNKSLPSISCS